MNKKVKSLLVAGLLIVGMSGNVFADGNGNDGCKVPGLRGEHEGNSHHITNITEAHWNEYVANFNASNDGKFKIEPSGNKFKVINLATGKQIEIIHVDFNKELTDEEKEAKNGDPVVPNLPTDDPETGDASMLVVGGSVIAAAAGLYMLNKKDDEE